MKEKIDNKVCNIKSLLEKLDNEVLTPSKIKLFIEKIDLIFGKYSGNIKDPDFKEKKDALC